MKLGLGLGLGALQGGVSFPSDLLLALPYDSLGEFAKANETQFNTYATTTTGFFNISGAGTGMQQAGSYLLQETAQNVSGGSTNYWVNTNGTRSAQYNSEYAAFSADPNIINSMIIYGGTNDSNPAGGITTSAYKAGLETLFSFYREDFPNIVKFFFVPLHRSLDPSASDANYQAVKEAQFEFVAEQSDVEWAGEIYDRDIAPSPDLVHPSNSEFQNEIARRNVQQIASIYEKTGAIGAIGPRVTGASWETDHALLTVTHDGNGSDFSTINAGAEDVFAFDVDGTVIRGSGVSRVNATTLKVDFDDQGFVTPDNDDSFKIGYGAMKDLARNSPVVVKDNATDPLPLRQRIITPTISDPLLGMDFTFDLSAKAGDRTVSGSAVTAITDRSGGTWTAASGREPTYEAADNGSLVAPDSSTSMRSPAFTPSSEGLVFIAWDCPSIPVNLQPFLLGTSTAGSLNTALYTNASDDLFWGQTSTNGFQQITSGYENEKAVICINYTSTTMDIYYNSTTPTVSFAPRNVFAAVNYIWLFTQSNSSTSAPDFKYQRVWFRNVNHGEAGDASISDIVTYLANHYGATLV